MIFFDKLVEKAATFFVGDSGLVEAAFSEDVSDDGIQHVLPIDASGNPLLSADMVYDSEVRLIPEATIDVTPDGSVDTTSNTVFGDILEFKDYGDPYIFWLDQKITGIVVDEIYFAGAVDLNANPGFDQYTENNDSSTSLGIQFLYPVTNWLKLDFAYPLTDGQRTPLPKYLRIGFRTGTNTTTNCFRARLFTTERQFVQKIAAGSQTITGA